MNSPVARSAVPQTEIQAYNPVGQWLHHGQLSSQKAKSRAV
jgi:hypothetical protein